MAELASQPRQGASRVHALITTMHCLFLTSLRGGNSFYFLKNCFNVNTFHMMLSSFQNCFSPHVAELLGENVKGRDSFYCHPNHILKYLILFSFSL